MTEAETLCTQSVLQTVLHRLTLTPMTASQGVLKQKFLLYRCLPVTQPTVLRNHGTKNLFYFTLHAARITVLQ